MPYNNPLDVLNLMADICSAKELKRIDNYWGPVNDVLKGQKGPDGWSLISFFGANRSLFSNLDFYVEVERLCQAMATILQTREDLNYTQVAVAGSFTAGKSSFLNVVTGARGLLPTGIEPVSVVPTYIYCDSKRNGLQVKGVNLRNVIVNLDKGVLQAIQHSSESNIYVASVLEKLFIELPTSERLSGLAFIDTPGYNNSSTKNSFSGKTDRETALTGMRDGDFLIWLVDATQGAVTKDDLEMIETFRGHVAIIFNKGDMMPQEDLSDMVYGYWEELSDKLGDKLIDIMAYSALNDELYFSASGYTMEQLFAKAKEYSSKTSASNKLAVKKQIKRLFENEYNHLLKIIKKAESQYKELSDRKKQAYDIYLNRKNVGKDFLENLKKLILNNYPFFLKRQNKATTFMSNYLNGWHTLIEIAREHSDGHWTNGDFEEKLNSNIDNYNSEINSYNTFINENYSYWEQDALNTFYNQVETDFAEIEKHAKEEYERLEEDMANNLKTRDEAKSIMGTLETFEKALNDAIWLGISNYKKTSSI